MHASTAHPEKRAIGEAALNSAIAFEEVARKRGWPIVVLLERCERTEAQRGKLGPCLMGAEGALEVAHALDALKNGTSAIDVAWDENLGLRFARADRDEAEVAAQREPNSAAPSAFEPARPYALIDKSPFIELPAAVWSEDAYRANSLVDELVTAYCVDIFKALEGFAIPPGRKAAYAWLVRRLEIAGCLTCVPGQAARLSLPPATRARHDAARETALHCHPRLGSTLELLAETARLLPAWIAGEMDDHTARARVMGDTRWERFFTNKNAYYATVNLLGADAADRATAGRALRVLEVGGGCGSAALALLERIHDRTASYCFTDLVPGLLSRGEEAVRRRFPSVDLSTRVVDLERPLAPQGVRLGEFDLVYAANAVHALRDTEGSLRELRAALAPGGAIVLAEYVRSCADHPVALEFFSQLFGLQRFFLPDEWQKLLEDAGFSNVRFTPDPAAAQRAVPTFGLAAVSAVSAAPEAALRPCAIDFVEAPTLAASALSLASRRLLVLCGEPPGEAILAFLSRLDYRLVVPEGISVPSAHPLDLTDDATLAASVAALDGWPFDAILALHDLQGLAPDSMTRGHDAVLELAFATCRHAYERLARGEVLFAGLCLNAWGPGPSLHPVTGLLGGFARSLASELPGSLIKVVHTDKRDPARLMNCLERELSAGRPREPVEVAYRAGCRLAAKLVAIAPLCAGEPLLDADSVVLAPGGARGVTAVLVEGLLERFGCTVVALDKAGPKTSARRCLRWMMRPLRARKRRFTKRNWHIIRAPRRPN